MAVVLPFVGNSYVVYILTLFLLYFVLAMGLSIAVTGAGLLNLGYMAFFGVGAYLYAVLNANFEVPFFVVVPFSGLAALLCGVVLGVPCLRVRGDYLAVATLSFGEIARLAALNWTELTSGPKGVYGIQSLAPFLSSSTNRILMYYLVAFLALLFSVVLVRLTLSPFARFLSALREDETVARVLGIDSTSWFLKAILIGAFLAGVCGAMFAAAQGYFSPQSMTLDGSILLLSIVVLAGRMRVGRLMVATFLLYLLPELLRGLQDYRSLAFGVVITVYVIGSEQLSKKSGRRRGEDCTPPYRSPEEADRLPGLAASSEAAKSLEIKNVTKRFGGIVALSELSLKLTFEGKIVGIVGPNGAGKTTLFNCLCGVESADSGLATLNGQKVRLNGRHSAAHLRIGRTFQGGRLFPSISVYENILMGALPGMQFGLLDCISLTRHHKEKENAAVRAAARSMKYCRLEEHASVLVDELPPGIKSVVEIARALSSDPAILLLDEPAAGLNRTEKESLRVLVKQISDELALPVLVIEHDMEFVMGLADEVVVLDSGKVLARGTPEAVSQDESVVAAYLGGAHAT